MNKSILEGSTKDKAFILFGFLEEDFEKEINKVDDQVLLREIALLAYQKDNDKFKNIVNKKIRSLGGTPEF